MSGNSTGLIGSGPIQGPKRVTRTGLALVHENEIVYPAAGNAAQAIEAVSDAKGAVQVFFPIRVEIRAASPERASGHDGRSADAHSDDLARSIDPSGE